MFVKCGKPLLYYNEENLFKDLFTLCEFYYLFINNFNLNNIFLFCPMVNSESCDSGLTVGDLSIEALNVYELGIITSVFK